MWLPSRTIPPKGTIAKARKAASADTNGARRYTGRSALVGVDRSLKNSLIPSASVWRIPNGPAWSGPIRFCMSAITLRMNQM